MLTPKGYRLPTSGSVLDAVLLGILNTLETNGLHLNSSCASPTFHNTKGVQPNLDTATFGYPSDDDQRNFRDANILLAIAQYFANHAGWYSSSELCIGVLFVAGLPITEHSV